MTHRMLLLAAPLLACLSAPQAQAQVRNQGKRQAAVTPTRLEVAGAPHHATLDLDSGRVQHRTALPSSDPRAISAICYDNSLDDDGFADALLYPPGSELFDWGVKSCGGSGFVDKITVGYASTARRTSIGGPGGALTLRVYTGATGFGQPGTLVATIPLSGLPSDPTSGGILIPHYVEVDLGTSSFFLPDGPIGWSYTNADGLTAPLLVDVNAALGTANAFDLYNPAPATIASFVSTTTLSAGGLSNDPKENSFYLQISQNDVVSSVTVVAAGSNPGIFSASAPVVGGTWLAVVDLRGLARRNGSSVVVLSTQRASNVQTEFGVLLVDLTTLYLPISSGLLDGHRFQIPLDPALLGVQLFAQGGYFSPNGFRLTNGLDVTIGSF